jgi:hypothetical protein
MCPFQRRAERVRTYDAGDARAAPCCRATPPQICAHSLAAPPAAVVSYLRRFMPTETRLSLWGRFGYSRLF